MKIRNILKLSMLILIANKNFATTLPDESENISQERASQFNPEESRIFQVEATDALERLFSKFLTNTNQENIYKVLLHGCAKERAAIAYKCKDAGLIDEEKASMFLSYRCEMDGGSGLINYNTPLIQKDNPNLFPQLNQNFMKGTTALGTIIYALSYMTYSEKQQISTDRQNKLDKLTKTSRPSPSDLGFMREDTFGEVECFEKLIAQQWVKINPEVAAHTTVGELPFVENSFFQSLKESNSEVVLATLRTYITLKESEVISIGSVNCLARRTETDYDYYNDFVVDHPRSNVIEPLLTYAERYWNASISWDKNNPSDFLSSLAQFFWAQTIAVPYARGSEAIAKWMLALTARYHGQELIYSSDFSFRMPFAMSSEEFIDYFKKNVSLKCDAESIL
jgi:hypothetical protein